MRRASSGSSLTRASTLVAVTNGAAAPPKSAELPIVMPPVVTASYGK